MTTIGSTFVTKASVMTERGSRKESVFLSRASQMLLKENVLVLFYCLTAVCIFLSYNVTEVSRARFRFTVKDSVTDSQQYFQQHMQ